MAQHTHPFVTPLQKRTASNHDALPPSLPIKKRRLSSSFSSSSSSSISIIHPHQSYYDTHLLIPKLDGSDDLPVKLPKYRKQSSSLILDKKNLQEYPVQQQSSSLLLPSTRKRGKLLKPLNYIFLITNLTLQENNRRGY